MNVDQEVKRILRELRRKVETGADGDIYGNRSEALNDIDALLTSPSTEGIKFLLLPTANLQELSMENNWGQIFNDLANELESLLGIS